MQTRKKQAAAARLLAPMDGGSLLCRLLSSTLHPLSSPLLSSLLLSSPLLSSPLLSLQLVFEPESAESEWLRLSSAERGQNHEYCVSIIGGWRLNKKCLFLGGGKELLAPNCV